ncbi:uncharacterized protein LOC130788266 [Actinidia eriantha]|uniref:uncharacterized protein LOC130788266 n=1 Tax=Actinidia eriantha TaxID=165200 RepID=UPI002582C0A6|nr:uncharacterized protein LOC130788266 [Actinidia eriantha]
MEIVPPLVTEEDQPLVTDNVPKHKEDDRTNLDEFKLESDPGLRNKIRSYPCNLQDSYRRAYWLKDIGDQTGGETFVGKGFTNWKKKEKLDEHVGGVNSAHYQAWKKCQDLVHQPQHIDTAYNKHSEQSKMDYRIRLCATIDCIRFLLKQGLAFRGHDESEDSDNRGNFLELLEFLSNHNNEVEAVVLKNASENLKLVSPSIQKDIVNAAAIKILNVIINDIGDECFSILVDESRDTSIKEQMAIVVRYVNAEGYVIESFLSLEHLQLALVAVAKKHYDVSWFFNLISNVLNVVGGSCKRHDTLLEIQASEVYKALNAGELQSGRGLNQESNLARASDTRWSSHYETLISFIKIFPAICGVLEKIREDGDGDNNGMANGLLLNIQQFDFVFNLHLMKTILAITNELSQALQRRDQDIVNAMHLVEISKKRLQGMREDGWDSFLNQLTLFCGKYDIHVPMMEEDYLVASRKKRGGCEVTNLHHYRAELFYTVLDMQLQELNDRFTVTTTELLICVACLSPANSFSAFDKQKLIRLTSFYPNDFSTHDCMVLEDQLDSYEYDMRYSSEFEGLKGLGELAQKMVETKRSGVYPLIYRLLKLALVLPVATTSVERAFSAMKIVKNRLRNRMGDQFLNDSLLVYIEKKRFKEISNDAIIVRFQKMKTRRGQL